MTMKRVRSDRGAVLPEYALIVALIVVVSLGAIQAIQDRGADRVENSDSRIGQPPDQANYAASATTTTIQATTTTSLPAGQVVRVGSMTAIPAPSQGSPDSKWIANVTIRVVDGSNQPVAGVIVGGSWSTNGQGQTSSCTTDAGGVCTVQRVDLNDNSPTESFSVTSMAKSGFTFVAGATDTFQVNCTVGLNASCD